MLKKPWEYYPDLSADRLIEIADILRSTRAAVLELHDETMGDDNWSLGCRVYACTKNRIIEAAYDSNTTMEWLSIVDPSLDFVFKIGDVPIRFYRGDADQPHPRALRINALEQQLSLDLFGKDTGNHLHWRFAIETDIDGAIQKIAVVGMTSTGIVECSWEVPPKAEETDIPASSGDTAVEEAGVDLPEPVIRLIARKKDESGTKD